MSQPAMEMIQIISNVLTVILLTEQLVRKVKAFAIRLSGNFNELTKNKIKEKNAIWRILKVSTRFFPIVLALSVLAWDVKAISPIDKILIIRIAVTVSLLFSNLLFLLLIYQIDKIRQQVLNQSILAGQVFG